MQNTPFFNVFLVPKDPRSLNGGTCCICSAGDREYAYSVALGFVTSRYPNDQELVLELCGEESPLGAFKEGVTGHVVVAVDHDEYLVITQV